MEISSQFLSKRSRYEVKNETLQPHKHEVIQVLHISSGCAKVETVDGTWVVPPHRAVWIPSSREHSVNYTGLIEVNNLYFPKKFSKYVPGTTCFVFDVSSLLSELFNHSVTLENRELQSEYGKSLFLLILNLIKRQSQNQNKKHIDLFIPTPQDSRLKKLTDLVLSDLSTSIRLSTLCKKAGISLRTAQRVFLKETQMTLSTWISYHRVLVSMEPLLQGKSITDIALDVGFASLASYSHCFKSFIGVSPKKFLRSQSHLRNAAR